MIGHLLPWKAKSARRNNAARYEPGTSTPFQFNEFIAIRDEPGGWFFLAQITTVGETFLIVHYYGTRLEESEVLPYFASTHPGQPHYIVAV
jgi:hypothetical protein